MLCTVLAADVPLGPVRIVEGPRAVSLDPEVYGNQIALFNRLDRLTAEADSSIIVLPRWLPLHLRHQICTVLAVLTDRTMAVIEPDLPPLATAVLAEQINALARQIPDPTRLASAAPLLSQTLLPGAWLPSVRGLHHQPVSGWSRLRSLMPGTRFLALLGPYPSVSAAGRADIDLPEPVRRTGLVMATEKGDSRWVRSHVAGPLGAAPVEEVIASHYSLAWWGCTRLVEFVAFTTEINALAELVLTNTLQSCSWCGMPVSGQLGEQPGSQAGSQRCVFCRAVADAPGAALHLTEASAMAGISEPGSSPRGFAR